MSAKRLRGPFRIFLPLRKYSFFPSQVAQPFASAAVAQALLSSPGTNLQQTLVGGLRLLHGSVGGAQRVVKAPQDVACCGGFTVTARIAACVLLCLCEHMHTPSAHARMTFGTEHLLLWPAQRRADPRTAAPIRLHQGQLDSSRDPENLRVWAVGSCHAGVELHGSPVHLHTRAGQHISMFAGVA
uniref:Uncharacterized protein n=1 Tax=Pan troglodytes TaxID=9598 RepID=A0A2I3SD14_PANTR